MWHKVYERKGRLLLPPPCLLHLLPRRPHSTTRVSSRRIQSGWSTISSTFPRFSSSRVQMEQASSSTRFPRNVKGAIDTAEWCKDFNWTRKCAAQGNKAPSKSSAAEVLRSHEALKKRRAWDFAISPLKSLPMQAFMLYMSGGGVQIFSMGIVAMLLLSPFKNLSAMNTGASPPPPPFVMLHNFIHLYVPFTPAHAPHIVFRFLTCHTLHPSLVPDAARRPPPAEQPSRHLLPAHSRPPQPSLSSPSLWRSSLTWYAMFSPSRSVFGNVGPWAYSRRALATGWRSRAADPPRRFRCFRQVCVRVGIMLFYRNYPPPSS